MCKIVANTETHVQSINHFKGSQGPDVGLPNLKNNGKAPQTVNATTDPPENQKY